MEIIAPWIGDNKQSHKLSQIMLHMTSTAVFPIFMTQFELTKTYFFNLEKYIGIYGKIIKVTSQMTKTGSKE